MGNFKPTVLQQAADESLRVFPEGSLLLALLDDLHHHLSPTKSTQTVSQVPENVKKPQKRSKYQGVQLDNLDGFLVVPRSLIHIKPVRRHSRVQIFTFQKLVPGAREIDYIDRIADT